MGAARSMRLFPVLLTALAVVMAGCADDEEPPADTTPTPSSPTVTTKASPTPANNTTQEPPTPTKPAPMELCSVSKEFSSNTPTPPATTASSTGDCGTVGAGYTAVKMDLNFTATGAFVGSGISVKLVDSAGTATLTCAGPGPGPATAAAPCTQEGPIAPGAYTLLYEGTGAVSVTGTVTIS